MSKLFTLILLAATLPNIILAQASEKKTLQNQTGKDFVSTREMDRINWMEFREAVPTKTSDSFAFDRNARAARCDK